MIAFFRLMVLGFIGLSLVYLLVSVYSRSVRRERLEKSWDADPPPDARPGDREAFIENGMEEYRHGLRRRLILLVYIIPLVAMAVTIYIVNMQ